MFRALPVCVLALILLAMPADARDRSVVTGVEPDDMLKLRAGPGTGYKVIVGLPEGTVVINKGCTRVGSTPWCEVALDAVPRLTGFVSGHYLKD